MQRNDHSAQQVSLSVSVLAADQLDCTLTARGRELDPVVAGVGAPIAEFESADDHAWSLSRRLAIPAMCCLIH
jgi:hypothetical protein